MDKEQIIEIIEKYSKNAITNILYASCFSKVADEILALQEPDPFSIGGKMAILKDCNCPDCQSRRNKGIAHRPNCTSIVYGRTEDPAKCICHSWQRMGDEPV